MPRREELLVELNGLALFVEFLEHQFYDGSKASKLRLARPCSLASPNGGRFRSDDG